MIECPLDNNLVGIRLYRPWCAALAALLALLASMFLTIKPRMYAERPPKIPGVPDGAGIFSISDFGKRIVIVVLCASGLLLLITPPVLNVCSSQCLNVTRRFHGVKQGERLTPTPLPPHRQD